MNDYEARQEAKRQRYLDRADRNEAEASRRFQSARDRLPDNGQPILVGHHSEKRHRNAIAKSDNDMRKGIEADNRADHYRAKAAAVGTGGISSDDPEALAKLKEKLRGLELSQAEMKAVNADYRALKRPDPKVDGPAWDELRRRMEGRRLEGTGPSPERMVDALRQAMIVCHWEKQPFPSWQLSNASAEIRRIKQRIAQLEAAAAAPEADNIEGEGWTITENREANRLQIIFDAKPDAEVRARLKANGFRWSRFHGAWQRHLNNAGRHAAKRALQLV